MNAAKLLKLAPLIIMVAFLAYAGYSIQASADDPVVAPSALANELDLVVKDIVAAGDALAAAPAAALRDPFQVTAKPIAAAGEASPTDDSAADPASDPLVELVAHMKLDGTFLQGRDQMAIIDGRIYRRGERLLVTDASGNSLSSLFVVNVLKASVVLHADGKNYVLGYPDQLLSTSNKAGRDGAGVSQESEMATIDAGGQIAMFQKLLNSPLGALGKSLVGKPGRSRGSRGSRAAKGATPSGNP